MKGRKPKPTALKLAEGNPGKRPLNMREPTPTGAAPKCPKHLDGEARKEWKRLAPELERMGLLTSVDGAALACYCEAWGTYVEALGRVKETGGNVVMGVEGEVKNKWRVIADDQARKIKGFMVEFGLTPSSRSRLVGKQAATPADELNEFIGGGMKLAN